MINALKKFRTNPKRTVLTLSVERRVTLNKLGDLTAKECFENKRFANYGDFAESSLYKRDAYSDYDKEEYVTENMNKCSGKRKNGCHLGGAEQSSVLEREDIRAFKETEHQGPLEWSSDAENGVKEALKPSREVKGGVALEKSFRILLCDLITALMTVVGVALAVKAIKSLFNR